MQINLIIISLLIHIPVYFFGNTSSSSIFIADLLILFFSLKNNFFKNWDLNTKYFFIFFLFISIISLFHVLGDYSNSYKFILYGCFKFFIYFLAYKLLTKSDINKIIYSNILLNSLIIYSIINIFNSSGLIDLSLINLTGHSFIYDIEYLNESIKNRIFLGNNSTSTSTILFLGIFILCYKEVFSLKNIFLIILFCISIAFTGSRTDFIAVSLFLIINSKLNLNYIFLISLFAIVFSLDITRSALTRIFQINILNELNNTAEGTLSYRNADWKNILAYLDNNYRLYFGHGLNNFRVLRDQGVVLINFGHNTFIHAFIELGLIAVLYLLLKLVKFTRNIFTTKNKKKRLFVATTFYLYVKMLTTDVIISVDNSLSLNIVLIVILYIIYYNLMRSKKPIK